MPWASLIFQSSDLIPAPLAQLGVAVALLWIVLQIVKQVRGMIGHRTVDEKSMDAKHEGHEFRIAQLEEEKKLYVTRTEYESRHRDIREQLGRIESKLDNLWGVRFKEGKS